MSNFPVMCDKLGKFLIGRQKKWQPLNRNRHHAKFIVHNLLSSLMTYANIIGYLIYSWVSIIYFHVAIDNNVFLDVQILSYLQDLSLLNSVTHLCVIGKTRVFEDRSNHINMNILGACRYLILPQCQMLTIHKSSCN